MIPECNEYKKLSKQEIMFSQLSLWSTVIDLSENQCDISTGLIVGGVKAGPGEFPHVRRELEALFRIFYYFLLDGSDRLSWS